MANLVETVERKALSEKILVLGIDGSRCNIKKSE